MKQSIVFEHVHSYDKYTDYEAIVEGKLYRLTLVEGEQPYVTVRDLEGNEL